MQEVPLSDSATGAELHPGKSGAWDAGGSSITAITGLEKGSGKTTLLNALLPLARRAGPAALFSIGVDGGLKARDASRPADVRVEPGDVVMTTDRFARASSARLEILDAPGERAALGHLVLGRVLRAGDVTLVGTQNLASLSETIDRVKTEGWAAAILVDGAASRLTQVGALGDAEFLFTARVDRGSLARVADRLRALVALASLPVIPDPPPETLRLDGPLTEETVEALPSGLASLSIPDFTKSFLPPALVLRLLDRVPCSVRRGFRLLGLAIVRRDVSSAELSQHLGPAASRMLVPNPYEVAA